MSTRTGMSFLTGIVRSEGGSILKSVSVAGIVPVM
jgi:short-subunit dehydrogenase